MMHFKTVSLIYGYSAKNAGDFAITLGAIDTLMKLGVCVKLFSRYCSQHNDFHYARKSLVERYGSDVEIYECPFSLDRSDSVLKTAHNYLDGLLAVIGLKRKKQFRQNFLDCDLVIFNGGNLFRCRSFIDFARLAALVYPLNIARKAKKPYLIFPQSASTLNYFGRLLLKPVLQNAKLVMLREQETYEYLNCIVPNAHFFQTIDLAFFIDKDNLPKTQKDYSGYVAFTLRFHTVGDIAYLQDNKRMRIFDVLGKVVDEFKMKRKVVIIVQTKKDAKLSLEFANQHKIELVECFDVPTLISTYKQVDLLIGMRLHSMILALSVGTPCLGVFYKEWGLKNSGLMSMFNMPYYFMDNNFSSSELLKTANKLLIDKSIYSERTLVLIYRNSREICKELTVINEI